MPAPAAPPDVVQGIEQALERRAVALRSGDEGGFEAGVSRSRRRFAREQATYFANLRRLPLAALSYDVDPGSLVRSDDAYWVTVQVSLQLEGYDAVPVVTPDRYRFARSAGSASRFVLTSVTDRAWEARNDVGSQPWDTGPIAVRRGTGVLGIFDPRSVRYADALVRSVQRGIADVSAVVPYDWSHSVVLYAPSDTRFLSGVADLPGGDPEGLDGVAFPVLAGPDDDTLASTRFVLHPRMLTRPGGGRDRLIRHELTHVAIGDRDDSAPLWLSEGLAEYVSVRPLDPRDRLLPERALRAAVRGFDDLPADASFNDRAAPAHYGLAWWACEYLATQAGEPVLWSLLDGLDAPGADRAAVLASLTGLTSRQLARKADKLLLSTFDR